MKVEDGEGSHLNMMNSIYELKDLVERLNETLSHLDESQGHDLKSLLEKENMPKMEEGSPEEEASESPDEAMSEGDKPKGLSIEKVEVLGKPKAGMSEDESNDKLPGEEEMSDDELNELLKKHLS
jgi:hypothetical protein